LLVLLGASIHDIFTAITKFTACDCIMRIHGRAIVSRMSRLHACGCHISVVSTCAWICHSVQDSLLIVPAVRWQGAQFSRFPNATRSRCCQLIAQRKDDLDEGGRLISRMHQRQRVLSAHRSDPQSQGSCTISIIGILSCVFRHSSRSVVGHSFSEAVVER
jgi:hypothetical protein